MTKHWFPGSAGRADAAARVFCLPYAGGSAAVYRDWVGALGTQLEVVPVQLPGRGWRLRERPLADLPVLAEAATAAIVALADRPIAVFGHSMGAWLGLEVVRRLEARAIQPMALFASGRQAPSLGCTQPPMGELDDQQFVAEVQRRYGGIPAEILAEPDVLALLLPALRADIAALERYRPPVGAPIAAPIVALTGEHDRVVAVADVAAWAGETRGDFTLHTFAGGHFYFQPEPGPLLGELSRWLRDRLLFSQLNLAVEA